MLKVAYVVAWVCHPLSGVGLLELESKSGRAVSLAAEAGHVSRVFGHLLVPGTRVAYREEGGVLTALRAARPA